MKKIIIFSYFIFAVCVLQAQQDNREEMRRYIRRAQTAYNAGEFSDALKEYKTALQLAPQYPELYKAIGDVYEKLGGTANIIEAATYYKRYLELSPDAEDKRAIQDKIYDLEYVQEKSEDQDRFLDDLSGIWVAVDNLEITNRNKKTGTMSWHTDFIFEITEIKKTGKYRVTIMKEGCDYFKESIIDKTVDIVPRKDKSFNFTIADAQAHTPNQGGYSVLRFGARLLGAATGMDLISDAANVAVDVAQANDLPSNTQTAYIFGLQYQDGKLEGLVNIIQRFASSNKQQTSRNDVYEITFVKGKKGNRNIEFSEDMIHAVENKPDIISLEKATFKQDKWGNKLSDNEIKNKLANVNPQLSERFQSAKQQKTIGKLLLTAGLLTTAASIPFLVIGSQQRRYIDYNYKYYDGNGQLQYGGYYDTNSPSLVTAGFVMLGAGAVTTIVSFPVIGTGSKKPLRVINEYNNQINQQMKDKPTAELRFGATSSGGIGFSLSF